MNLAIIDMAMLVLLLILFLLFIVLAISIYRNNCTLRLFLIWLLVYALLSASNFLFLSGAEREDIRLYVLSNISIVSFFASSFFILRIERRCVSSQYIIGLSVSFLIFLSSVALYNPTTSFVLGSLRIYLLMPIMIYINNLHNGKRIKYPTILITILLCFVCIESVLSTLYNALIGLFYLFLLFFMVMFFSKRHDIQQWFYISSNETDKHVEQENCFLNRGVDYIKTKIPILRTPIEPSGEPLCNEIDDAIISNEKLNINKYDPRKLQFMLTCAKLRRDTISRHLSLIQNIYLIGFTIILYPFLKILDLFIGYGAPLQSETSEIIDQIPLLQSVGSYFYQSIMCAISANKHLGMFIAVLLVFSIFLGLMAFSSLSEPNSRIKLWIRRHKKINLVYEFIWMVVLAAVLIGRFLSIKIDSIDLTVFICSTVIIVVSGYNLNFVRKQLKTTEKMILDLNEAIIFKNVYHFRKFMTSI